MKSVKELNLLRDAIGKAEYDYSQAVILNITECGKELMVAGDDESEKGLRFDFMGRHGMVNVVVDRVRFNKDRGIVEAHLCEEDYEEKDYWYNVSIFGDEKFAIYEKIVWEDDEEKELQWKKVVGGVVFISKRMYEKEHETIVQVAADIYEKVYGLNNVHDFNTASSIVRDVALEFEQKFQKMGEDADYLDELAKFEEEKMAELHKQYD